MEVCSSTIKSNELTIDRKPDLSLLHAANMDSNRYHTGSNRHFNACHQFLSGHTLVTHADSNVFPDSIGRLLRIVSAYAGNLAKLQSSNRHLI